MTVSDFLSHVEHTRRSSRGWVARCPAHNDRSPSLSISEGDDGRVLLHCFAGCTAEEIVEAVGLNLSDLFEGNQSRESRNQHREIRKKSKAINDAGFSLAVAYQRAEKILEAAKGLDTSSWSEGERDLRMDMICEAYLVLDGEKQL